MTEGLPRTAGSDELLSRLLIIPPDLTAIESLIREKQYDKNTVSRAGYDFVMRCFEIEREIYNDIEKHRFDDAVLDMSRSSAYLPEITGLLLQYGLDPNAVCDDDNIMAVVRYVVNGYAAADTLSLLLEHGGDPCMVVDGMDLYDVIDFDVMFDAFNQADCRAYDSLIHCWFVLLGFSDNVIHGKEAVTVFPEPRSDRNTGAFRICDLKQHRNFDFMISNVPTHGENWSLHIFDKRTRWETARL